MSGHTFKVGDWVWDGDQYGSIVADNTARAGAIGGFIEPTVDLFDGKDRWTVDIKSIMPDRRPIGYCDRP